MNEQIIYPALILISGVLLATVLIIFLKRISNKIIRFFELYPESRGILSFSLKFISWFISIIIFLIFVRWALAYLNLEFTKNFVEEIIKNSPRYIFAVLLILAGFYTSRIIRERSKEYRFEFKDRVLLVIDFIVHMTFIFTALYSIGIETLFFLEFYRVILWIIGAIIALVVSMSIGIPLGISIYDRMKKDNRKKK